MQLLEDDYNLSLKEISKKYGVTKYDAQIMRADAGLFRFFNILEHTREEILVERAYSTKEEFMQKYKIQTLEYTSVLRFYGITRSDILKKLLDDDIYRVLDLIGPEAFNKITYDKFGKYTYNAIINHYGGIKNLYKVFGIEKSSFQDKFLHYFEDLSNIKLKREVSFETCINPVTGKKLRFDGYSENPPFLLEVDDISHSMPIVKFGGKESLLERQARDHVKDEWAIENNIKLYRVSSTSDWKKQIQFILDDIHSTTNYVVDTTVKPINSGFIGVSKLNGRWNVRVCMGKGRVAHLGSYDSDLYAAIIREKYLMSTGDEYPQRNNITFDDLKEFGFSSWNDVPLVRENVLQNSKLENFNSPERRALQVDVNTKKKYIGLKKLRDSFSAVVNVNGKSVQLGVFKSDKAAAIFREGYIIEHNLNLRKNGFSLVDLQEFGISKWEDYKLLKRKKMRGVYFSEFYNAWGFKVVLFNTEFKGQYSVLGFESEIAAAIYRERLLQLFVKDGKERFNFITSSELESLGFSSFEDVPCYNLKKRSFDTEVPFYKEIPYKNQYF